MPSNHALLSPSASHRWLNCSAAPMLEQTMPDNTTVFAEEGTLAHAICEAKLHELLSEGKVTARQAYKKLNGDQPWTAHKLYSAEMEETSDFYRDVVASKLIAAREKTPDAALVIEQPLDLTSWIPEGFGTSDAIVVADGNMDVIDYKHGKGVEVSAEENTQMMIYALGAYEALSYEYDIKEVTMTIIQPRLGNVSTYNMTIDALLKWARNELKPKAQLAYRGALEQADVVQHPGEWCKFCKVRSICKALANQALETASENIRSRLLTPEEVAELLPKVPQIKTWANDIEAYALNQALQGEEIPGYKVVEGRSVRQIADPEAIAHKLYLEGYSHLQIFKPQELLPITGLETIVGKKKFATIAGDLIVKPQGKPTLVPESDKRKAILSNDFEHIINQ